MASPGGMSRALSPGERHPRGPRDLDAHHGRMTRLLTTPLIPTSELRRRGMGRAAVEREVHEGRLWQVHRGWYAQPGTDAQLIRAMRLGGRLGCVSALRLYGAWIPPDSGLHLLMPRSASGRRLTGDRTRRSPRRRLVGTRARRARDARSTGSVRTGPAPHRAPAATGLHRPPLQLCPSLLRLGSGARHRARRPRPAVKLPPNGSSPPDLALSRSFDTSAGLIPAFVPAEARFSLLSARAPVRGRARRGSPRRSGRRRSGTAGGPCRH